MVARSTVGWLSAAAVAGSALECRSAGAGAAARGEGAPLAVCGCRGDRFSSLPAGMRAGLRSYAMHRDVRGWEKPSDHAPVMVTLDV